MKAIVQAVCVSCLLVAIASLVFITASIYRWPTESLEILLLASYEGVKTVISLILVIPTLFGIVSFVNWILHRNKIVKWFMAIAFALLLVLIVLPKILAIFVAAVVVMAVIVLRESDCLFLLWVILPVSIVTSIGVYGLEPTWLVVWTVVELITVQLATTFGLLALLIGVIYVLFSRRRLVSVFA